MSRSVLAVERSPLARNVYSIILSQIDEIFLTGDVYESFEGLKEDARRSDLLLISESTIEGKKADYLKLVKELSGKVPCVIFIHPGTAPDWSDFSKIKRVELLERPFFPDDFLSVAKRLWGSK